ncbi:hypothetical protein [Spirochaeta dissipatitropha]
MDIQLKELIDKIKQDGIGEAESEAEKILQTSRQNAQTIIEKAKAEADQIRQAAKADADKFKQAGAAAVQQAARDIILQTQNRIEKIFDQVVNNSVKSQFSAEILKDAVVALMKNWQGQAVSDLAVFISDDMFAAAEKSLKSELATQLKQGLDIYPSEKIKYGFRVGAKDGSAFYEISADSLGALLASRVNSSVGELIKAAAEQE